MKDFMQMLSQVKEAQAKIQEVQQKVAQLQATGESGAGLVQVTVNGNKKILHIQIDPSIIQADEQQTLQDLIVAAVNMAMQRVDAKIKEMVQAHTAGVLGNLPVDLLL
ncbi:MAG: nucleoid-associated protein, YbaB/EbfC family [Candidatus Amoebophilus sp. 36-38]|nr:MAG: nucleoid-associated protein, YbaB/EbfC family [Candidatus Amoebophilus sp. 36-38]